MGKRNHKIIVHCSAEEKRSIIETAEGMGYPASIYLRVLGLQRPKLIEIQQNGTKRRRW